MKRSVLIFSLLALVVSGYAQTKLTSIDFPGGTLTTARSINNHGEIVGAYRIVAPRHAMLIKGGKFIPLAPTTVLGTNYSEAFKNNDLGDIVGEYGGDDGFFHGFLLSKGALTTLDFPGASDSYAFGINDTGTVVGYWDLVDAAGDLLAYNGFSWKNGSFTEVNFPGSGDSTTLGNNVRGDFVGAWDSGITSPIGHAFVCSNGKCSSFDAPVAEATITQAVAINAIGQIVGTYVDGDGVTHAFLMAGANFTSFDFPGATSTSAWGINSPGQIVGTYIAADGSHHGFLAQPGH
jgi:probable HAF family extracellular repeat protein